MSYLFEPRSLSKGLVVSMEQPLMPSVTRLAGLLQGRSKRIVFAESCTAGLVSASLARVPRISSYLCGSAVVYRLDTKANWLNIPADVLSDPGPVSTVVATLMAEGVLQRTPEADLAVSVTGHLGPGAPDELDGVIYIGIAWRILTNRSSTRTIHVERHDLPSKPKFDDADLTAFDGIAGGCRIGETIRENRQWLAAKLVLEAASDQLEACVD